MDIRPEQLEKWGKDFGVTAFYNNLDKMMEKEKPDIVSICTYPDTHCPLTVKAASYGVKSIICEKPMALNMGKAEQMIQECEEHNVKLVIGHQRHHRNTASVYQTSY